MADVDKRWFEVTGSVNYWFALKVLARDRDEAEELFWQSDAELETILTHWTGVEVTSVDECETNAEGEQVANQESAHVRKMV